VRGEVITSPQVQWAPSSLVYYRGRYWNDYAAVRAEINRRLTGDSSLDWYRFFHEMVGRRKFHKALILNCGNGWVERALFDAGLFDEALAVDYSEDLIAAAKAAAGGRPIRYRAMDINTIDFGESGFDLVVNHAAGHHIRWIDRVYAEIARMLTENGYFLQYDYVGAHRNQYRPSQWKRVCEVNEQLPEGARQNLAYHDHATLLHTDPTEAIHSELIVETTRRYFSIKHHTHAGGAIAYPLLTHNRKIWDLPEDERDAAVRQILETDGAYLARFPNRSMFDLIIAKPRRAKAIEGASARFSVVEAAREALADCHEGVYYYPRFFTGSARLVVGDSARTYLRSGFSVPEPHGTWTIGFSSVMCLRAVSKEPLRLVLDVRPFVVENQIRRQRVYAVVNGRLAAEVECTERTAIPVPLLQSRPGDHNFRIVLLLPDAAAPATYSETNDQRPLGICISKVTLERGSCS
jgi:SAM-dependent methyltransferase